MHLRLNKIYGRLLIYGVVLCMIPVYASARVHKTTKKTIHPRHQAATASHPASHSHHSRLSRASHSLRFVHHRRSRSAKSRSHHRSSRHRAASLRIPASRTSQIQQALIQAGDLHEQPTGKWDSQTREAMKRYQQANGFASTGLPDAKSLMKMGLGPHPLPKDVTPVAQTKPPAGQPPVEVSRTGQTGPHYE